MYVLEVEEVLRETKPGILEGTQERADRVFGRTGCRGSKQSRSSKDLWGGRNPENLRSQSCKESFVDD